MSVENKCFVCKEDSNVHELSKRSVYLICQNCRTVFRFENLGYEYTDLYPEMREHQSPGVFLQKKKTTMNWLRWTNTKLSKVNALDFGFGGGGSLAALNEAGVARIYGIEPVKANRLSAGRLGIENLILAASIYDLKLRPEDEVDFLLYSDSFEHEKEPRRHIEFISEVTKKDARALLVMPRGDSFSRRVMGKYWIHNVPEHWVHYSLHGLLDLWAEYGWCLEQKFFPWKNVSLATIGHHLQLMKLGGFKMESALSIPFNFGEMGLVLRKQ